MTTSLIEASVVTVLAAAEYVLYSAPEEALDEALAETFPSSDPVAISITRALPAFPD